VRVAFAAARSSPGVTTAMLACASVWPGRVLLVEASEDGGALAARFGLRVEPGLMTLAAACRHTSNGERPSGLLAEHVQPLPGTDRIDALVGPASLEPAQVLLRTSAGRLAGMLDDVEADVLIDAGRLPAAPLAGPLLEVADRLVLVVRPRLEELTALAHRLPLLAGVGPPLLVLLVGERPYGPREVADTLGIPVLGALADDSDAAEALTATGPTRGLARSALLRSATGLVDELTADRPAPQPDERATGQVNGHATGSRRRRLVRGRG
jgi:Mrp family chromosome partitioning ATPase